MTLPAMAAVAVGCGIAFDVINVRFIQASTQRRPWAASVYSTILGGIGLTGTMEAIHSAWTIPFLLIGYFIGTFIGVKYGR